MSAIGTKQTSRSPRLMSAFGGKADANDVTAPESVAKLRHKIIVDTDARCGAVRVLSGEIAAGVGCANPLILWWAL